MCNKQYLMMLGGMVSATMLAGIACVAPGVVATSSASSTATVSVLPSCSMTGTEVTSHSKSVANGTSETGIGETRLKTVCNDKSGYALYAIGYGQDTLGNTVLHSSDLDPSYDIATGTTTGGNSQWSMQLSAVSGTYAPSIVNDFDKAHTVPSTFTKVAEYDLATDDTGSTVSTSYNAYISGTQPAGSYSGKVKYVLVHPSSASNPVKYSITYNQNTTDTVTGMPSNVSDAITNDPSVDISSDVPERDGYVFKGWCTVQTPDDIDASACITAGGTTYNPDGGGTNLSWTIDQTVASNSLSIYAMWKVGKVYMQDFTLSDCQSLASSTNYTVYDRRDDSDYTVRYINDACWMTQNLRITNTTGQSNGIILKDGSNFSANSVNIFAGGDLTAGNTYTEARSHKANATDAAASNNQYTINQLGAWYNYCAASAGTVCSQSYQDATQDICPSGWHLPSYNVNPGSISGITSYATEFQPLYGGFYYYGSLSSATSYGSWWSSKASNVVNQYRLGYSYGSLYPNSSNDKYYGLYIRCTRTQ